MSNELHYALKHLHPTIRAKTKDGAIVEWNGPGSAPDESALIAQWKAEGEPSAKKNRENSLNALKAKAANETVTFGDLRDAGYDI